MPELLYEEKWCRIVLIDNGTLRYEVKTHDAMGADCWGPAANERGMLEAAVLELSKRAAALESVNRELGANLGPEENDE